MWQRLALIIGVLGLGLLLNGCSKCGPFWEDWMQPSRACRSDHL
jgi:hypothetical protein